VADRRRGCCLCYVDIVERPPRGQPTSPSRPPPFPHYYRSFINNMHLGDLIGRSTNPMHESTSSGRTVWTGRPNAENLFQTKLAYI